jgi:hypothetical protein
MNEPSPNYQTTEPVKARAGDLIEAEVQTYRDGEKAGTRTMTVRLDRDPWPGGPGSTVVSDGRGVDAVLTDSIRIIERAPAEADPTPNSTFAEQEAAVAALADMAEAFPHLPAALIQLPHVYPGRLDISLHDSAADFEAWREALCLPAEAVELLHFKGSSWLAVSGSWGGASVKLAGHVIPPVESRPSCQLLEQRHQLDAADAGFRALAPVGGGSGE